MITDKDIEKLKDTFATKDDLKGFATKDDLKKSENRADKQFVSLDKKMDFLAENMVKHEQRLNDIDVTLKRFDTIEAMLKEIMSSLNIKSGRDEEFKSEQAAVHHKLDRHDGWSSVLSAGTGIPLPA